MDAAVLMNPAEHRLDEGRPELLRSFLNAYWLRPENALWMAIRSQVLAACELTRPSLDLCCGDGIFSFLHSGGRFGPTFDVFSSVGGLDRVRSEHHDIFDHIDDGYAPRVLTPPQTRWDVGCDGKASLLGRAARLDLFDRLVEHDANEPLPFEDGEFATVYCNSAYWIAHIDGFLGELRRITRDGGQIILHLKLDSMRGYNLERHRSLLGNRFCDLIARGRLDCWPTLADRTTWEKRFERAGLTVVDERAFISRTQAHIWDIGLRPLAPMLIRMANGLSPELRASVKQEWIETLMDLAEPFCRPCVDLFGGQDEPAEVQYVLAPA